MKRSIHLSGADRKALQALLESRWTVRAGKSESARGRRLESVEGSLGKAGRILLETDEALELYDEEDFPFGAPLMRGPWERAPKLVPQALPEGPLRSNLESMLGLRAAVAGPWGRLERGSLALLDGEDKTVVRLALAGWRPVGGRRPSATWVRVEPLRGYEEEGWAVTAALAPLRAEEPCSDGVWSPVPDFGYGVSGKVALDFDPRAPAGEVLPMLLGRLLAAARSTEAGIIADVDTEFLHDFRVHLRRMRSLLALLPGVWPKAETRALRGQLGNLARATNRLRDLDVQLLEERSLEAQVPASLRDGLAMLFERLRSERKREYRAVARRLRAAQTQRELAALEERLTEPDARPAGKHAERPVAILAEGAVEQRLHALREAGEALEASAPEAAVHALRIEVKRLRYVIELLAPCFAASPKPLVKRLKALQDSLGAFNDACVRQALLTPWLAAADPPLAASLGALLALAEEEKEARRAEVPARWAVFAKAVRTAPPRVTTLPPLPA
ncbi:MAG: CHAD domain-containing protein [Opitutales bacterium]